MHNLSVSVPHSLEKAEAESRISSLLSELKEQHGSRISELQESWEEDRTLFSFRLMGMPVTGQLQVDPCQVTLEGVMPPLAVPFRSVIEQAILEKARELLG